MTAGVDVPMKRKFFIRISDDLALPVDTVTSTLVVYGGKGMGKTNFGSVLVEELARLHLRWSWLDPLGVSWGLRHSKDGKGAGIECVILGGPHGDVPIEPTGGAAVADIVVEMGGNFLIDFSRKASGEMWSIAERIRFVTAYTRRLFQRQGDLVHGQRREPIFQVLDEAARYVPQTVPAGNPDLSMCVSAWQQLVEEGRNVGIGVGLISQRSARMNKDVSELADAMVAFRTVGPNSLAAVLDWLGEHVARDRIKDLSEKVRKLPVGHALCVSPGWLDYEGIIPIRARETFDSSATPKPGEKARVGAPALPRLELSEIRARMAETIERAKQDDPKLLRAKVAELEKQLREGATHAGKETRPLPWPIVFQPVFEEGAFAELTRGIEGALGVAHSKCRDALASVELALNNARGELHTYKSRVLAAKKTSEKAAEKIRSSGQESPPAVRGPVMGSDRGPRAAARTSTGDSTPGLTPPGVGSFSLGRTTKDGTPRMDRRFLIALAQYPAGRTRQQVLTLAGYADSGPVSKSFARLRANGWVVDDDGLMKITPAGTAAAGDFERLPTGNDLIDYWVHKLNRMAARFLFVLAENRGTTLSRIDLLAKADYADSGPVSKALALLRRLELMKDQGRGLVLNEETFS